MTISPGTRLGVYEITAQIGEGGMGQVYRARDTKLNRDVALKVLPEAFAGDPDRLARFQREAQLLASLNHPNIGAIHGVEEGPVESPAHAGPHIRALVMELVEGEDLSQRIARGPIPLEEALPIAKQIASALEAAHEQGIIHRDLKPANIKVRDDGTVKVLDFGLAKAVERATETGRENLTHSPTITSPAMMTGAGMILGTAAYMSPEQARGKAVDKRADIWAFGVVVFEMLAGHRAFVADDISLTLASIMMKEPDWNALPESTPAGLRRLLKQCLKKDVRERIRDIGDARLQIDELLSGTPEDSKLVPAAPAAPRWPPTAPWLIASIMVATAAISESASWWATRPAPAPGPDLARFTMTLPEGQRLAAGSPDRDVAIAPDGRHLVFQEATNSTPTQLVVRAIDQLEASPLRGITGPRWPFISPDSRWIGFFALGGQGANQAGGELKKVSMTGGPSVTICRIQGSLAGASWGPDETIVFATLDPTTGLLSVPSGGGEPKVLTKPDPSQNERDHLFPSVLPDGHAVLFTIAPTIGPMENAQVAVLDLKTGKKKTLIRGGSQAEYVETGHLIYAVTGTLRAVRFDPVALEVLGEPIPVIERVLTKANGTTADFSVSRHGTLVYVAGTTAARAIPRTLVWVDRKGHEEPIPVPPRAYVSARVSPDGTRLALDARDEQNDIWIWDLARQTLQRLTNDPGFNRSPVWTPDGRRVAFTAEHDGVESVYWQAFDGSGTSERLSSGTRIELPLSFSPDGAQLMFKTPLGVMPFGNSPR